jgi:hypothetical protein
MLYPEWHDRRFNSVLFQGHSFPPKRHVAAAFGHIIAIAMTKSQMKRSAQGAKPFISTSLSEDLQCRSMAR